MVTSNKKQWHLAQTLQIRETILRECQERLEKDESDTWALEVNKRIQGCIDFVASEARYHRYCRVRFSCGKTLQPQNRSRNEDIMYFFKKICEWIELETDIHTVT